MSKISRRTKYGSRKAPPTVEEIVHDLETMDEMRRLLKKQLAWTARKLREIKVEPNSERAKMMLGPLTENYDVAAKLLNTLNDSIWTSIILRAKLNRGERGPTFDDPEKLRKYLAAH